MSSPVPDHFHLECAAALRRMELRGELTAVDAQTAFDQMLALGVRRVDTAPSLREAWSMRPNVAVAHALYLVIAQPLRLPLVTSDVRLAQAPGLGVHVLTLDPLPGP